MSYLKIRAIASKIGGRFYLEDAVKVLGLSERTTKKHLSAIKEVTKTSTGYKLSRHRSLSTKNTFVLISHDQLFSYSWKNIGEFHAYLAEIELSRYKRHQNTVVKGYRSYNAKDRIFEKVQDGKKAQFHNLMSIECSSLVVKKSTATISRYKKVQSVSSYRSKKVIEFDRKYFKKDGEFNFTKYLSENKGIFVNTKDSFYFSPISNRATSLKIKFG